MNIADHPLSPGTWICPGCQVPKSLLVLPADHAAYCQGIPNTDEAQTQAVIDWAPVFAAAWAVVYNEPDGKTK